MVEELEGGQKADESMAGLVRARKFLQRRFGSVFGELRRADLAEPKRSATGRRSFAEEATPEDGAAKRAFVQQLGNRIVERINWATVANATSVAACGAARRIGGAACCRSELAERMQQVVDLLRLQDVRHHAGPRPRTRGASTSRSPSMLRMDLIRTAEDPRGEILYFEESRRRALDFYRNSILHFLALPSWLARRLLAGPAGPEARRELAEWLDLFYTEFFTPRGEVLASSHRRLPADHFERCGWLEKSGGELRATEKGRPGFRFLAEQTRGIVEAYYCARAGRWPHCPRATSG